LQKARGTLQLINAVVEPGKVDEIVDALQSLGFHGFTAIEALGFGKRRGPIEIYRGATYGNSFRQRVKIEIVARDDEVEEMINVICKAAATSHGEDDVGKLWVVPVSAFVRMRTRQTGVEAL
jgi:nitrogen regulatory protein P-II 1